MKHSFLIVLTAALAVMGLTARTASAASYTNTISHMRASITNQMAANNVQGMSIALVDNQAVVWAAGFGYADREAAVAADADTVYHVGSVSKAFLGTAYMQLLDRGQLHLEAPITNYIPEFSMLSRFTNSGPVTVRSLLNHHSGVPGDFFNGMVTLQVRDDYAEWLLTCLRDDYPFAPINTRNSYCNSGFALLTEALRRITSTHFAAFTEAMIFAPLGMTSSSFLPDKPAILNRMAAAYGWEGERQPPEIWNPLGSGSMYSSANDLTKYIRMILADGRYAGKTLVSSNAIDTMTAPQLTHLQLNVADQPGGLGWDNVDESHMRYAGRVFWKNGATWYHCAFLGISRDLKLGVAVIQNSPGSLCDGVGIEAMRWAILDKTGVHWPTNKFVPPPSPITNRPQVELDALAGLYVGESGYHRVIAGAGTLTFIGNAHSDSPDIVSNIVPRANGWFSKTTSQDDQLAFTNLAGHDMLVLHRAAGALESASPLGERYVPGPLPAAWRARTNRVYRMVDMHPADYFWYPGQPIAKTLRLAAKDEALMTSWMQGVFVIEPQTGTLAFPRGTHFRKGGAVRVATTNGFDLLHYSSYRFLDEAAIPTLPASSIASGAIPFANGTQWYWFTGQSGLSYRARMSAPDRNYFVRITDREGIVLASGTNGPATWACVSNGTYAIALCAAHTSAFTASLTLCGLRQAQSDYDGDGKADPAAYDAASAQWRVALSRSSYAMHSESLGTLGSIGCSADFDGDEKADPAAYDPVSGLLVVRLSSQSYGLERMPTGIAGGTPLFADFDGDRKADPSVYAAAQARITSWLSGLGYVQASVPLGGAEWLNAVEDYDGDAKSDPAVYHPPAGQWQILLSAQGYASVAFGLSGGAGSLPAPGDYDGDGKADPAVFQPAGGLWLCMLSSQGYNTVGMSGFGGPDSQPCSADYDNDGKTDPATYDPAVRVFSVLLSGSKYQLISLPLCGALSASPSGHTLNSVPESPGEDTGLAE